jgi:hypothetical protein
MATLTGIATGLLPRLLIGVQSDVAQRLARQFIESVITGVEPRNQLLLHARCPETFYMIPDAGNRFVAIRLRAKEISNVVCHPR